MNPTDHLDEVQEGEIAFFQGETKFDCPYPYNDPKHEAWVYGWERKMVEAV